MARIAQEKLAQDILMLDLTEIEASPADWFVICTVNSSTQLRAVIDAISKATRDVGLGKPRVEGLSSEQWVILDYFDIVVHVMVGEAREFYKLERLWGDAKMYTLTAGGAAKAATPKATTAKKATTTKKGTT
jgi:ribosome-associated protein